MKKRLLEYPYRFCIEAKQVLSFFFPEREMAINRDLEQGSLLVGQQLEEVTKLAQNEDFVGAFVEAIEIEHGRYLDEVYGAAVRILQARELREVFERLYEEQLGKPSSLFGYS